MGLGAPRPEVSSGLSPELADALSALVSASVEGGMLLRTNLLRE